MERAKSRLAPVIQVDKDRCVNCHACISVCPVKLCNDGSGPYVNVNADSCIGCGRCLAGCTHNARRLVDDFDAFQKAVERRQKLIAIVAPSAAANFPERHLNLNGWLQSQGIEAVFDVSFGAELSAKSYVEHIRRNRPKVVIAQPCPAIVTYLQVYQPELLEHLAPVDSPMVHTMKMVRRYNPRYAGHKIVVISPCLAKKREFDETTLGDFNCTYVSLQEHFDAHGIDLADFPRVDFDTPHPERAVAFPTPGGLLRTVQRWIPEITGLARKIEGDQTVYDYLKTLPETLAGRPDVAPLLIDCLNCTHGCNAGPATLVREKSPDEIEHWIERRCQGAKDHYANAAPGAPREELDRLIEQHWDAGLYQRAYADLSQNSSVLLPNELERKAILRAMRKYSHKDLYNCSACGYGTCEQMTMAIHNNLNRAENCHHCLIAAADAAQEELTQYRDHLVSRVEQRSTEVAKANELLQREIDEHRQTEATLRESEQQIKNYASVLEKTNQALKKANAAAKEATQAKSEFLANMSHEIRTPMTAILGFADLLAEHATSPECAESAQTIRRNGEYLLALINDILDLSKVESGKLRVEKISTSPHQVISEVTSLMKVRASAKGLVLQIEYEGLIPETIRTDPVRLRQVLINIIGNAVKFTEVGSIRLRTRLIAADTPDPKLQFRVTDTGIGMTEQQVARLFRPFTQADASTTRKFGGTGLGLTISQRLAQMLGGTISVRSATDRGSTFSLTVATGPLDGVKLLGRVPNSFARPHEPEAPPSAESSQLDCRVLLAEDGPDNQRLISFMLKKAGATVTLVDNGADAVDAALQAREREPPFDVILMDMQMPILDGYAATSQLRDHGYLGPVIALTAHAMSSDRQKCLDAGCDDYAAKPINRDRLIALVAKHARQRVAAS